MNRPLPRSGRDVLAIVIGLVAAAGLLTVGITKEVPLGSLEGTALLPEGKGPLPGATVVLRPAFDLPDYEFRSRSTKADREGRFAFRNIPAGPYFVEAFGKAHSVERVFVRVEEGERLTKDLQLAAQPPRLELFANQRVFGPREEVQVKIQGFLAQDELEAGVYRLRREAVERTRSLYDVLRPLAYPAPGVDPASSPDVERLVTRSVPVQNRDPEGVFSMDLAFGSLPEGLYWVTVRAGDLRASAYLTVSRIALVTKTAGRQIYAMVTEIDTGAPVPGARVRALFGDESIEFGETDARGRVDGFLPSGPSGRVMVTASAGPSFAATEPYLREEPSGALRIWTYTDRPVYRPGDEVHLKGIVRAAAENGYSLPSAGDVRIEVFSPDQMTREVWVVPLSERGTFAHSFRLAPGLTGYYQVDFLVGGAKESMVVPVLAYRKPDFKMTVTPERPYYVRGERVRVRVKCEYYFGGPVVGASLTGAVFASPDWSSMWPDALYDLAEGDGMTGGGQMLAEFAAVTDAAGEAVLELAPDVRIPADLARSDLVLSFVVAGTESEDRFFNGEGRVRLVQGEYAIRAEVDRYVTAPGEPITVQANAAFHEGGGPAAGERITFEWGLEQWTGARMAYTRLGTQTAVTDEKGVATVTIAPETPGGLVIRVSGLDRRRNRIGTEAFVYVSAAGFQFERPLARLELALERKRAQPGEEIVALVTAAEPGGAVWVTVESDRVHWESIVRLEGRSGTVRIPVTADFAPAVLVCATAVRGKTFQEARRRLDVIEESRRLTLEITPDREVLEPGQLVTYEIRARTADGRPARAELSLGVVDESIYAIAEDRQDPYRAFYPLRYHSVRTEYSFPEIYLDGGAKDDVSTEVRQNFLDTAYWNPTVLTDAEGKATVSVRLPDNLTSWRATVVGVTERTDVGRATTNVRVRKPLMVRLSVPDGLTQTDRFRITGLVTNDTGRAADVTVELAATGVTLTDRASQSARLAAGETRSFAWTAEAREPGPVSLTLTAISGEFRDAMRLGTSIRAHGPVVRTYEAKDVESDTEWTVERLKGAREGTVTLTLSPSLAGAVLESLDELVDYPYGCVEQTVNRFVPAVVVTKTLRDLGLRWTGLEFELASVTREGLARLWQMQTSLGGWGWWEGERPDPGITALVLEGLHLAREAGVDVAPRMIEQGVQWAKAFLAEPPPPAEAYREAPWYLRQREFDEVSLAYAVLLFEDAPVAVSRLRRAELGRLDAEGLSVFALAAHRAVIRGMGEDLAARRAEALGRLLARARGQDTIVFTDGWGYAPTARALQALLAIDPSRPETRGLVRGLMASRRGQGWTSTRDSGLAVLALTEFIRLTDDLGQASSWRLVVNGEERERFAFEAGSTESRTVTLPIAMLGEGPNRVALVADQPGRLHVTVETRQVPFQNEVPASFSDGFSVERSFHRLEATRLEDGSLRLMPSARPVERFRSGELVRCKVRLRASEPMQFLLVEVPTPSSLRVLEDDTPAWWWWFDGLQVLDDRIAFFVRLLPAGESTLEFNLRAEAPGDCAALPVEAYGMYSPDQRASSSSLRLEVRPSR